ncbi:hypothetical protein RRG08_032743 [Elysia crispata]|uniref:Uncharacterized protein n=1 Tax=Elysia crispata TaxID=231223 RepID=A0AAE0YV08_9GAST|nr:hypothetical protein RRG08_032743 [Elysia crispata]
MSDALTPSNSISWSRGRQGGRRRSCLGAERSLEFSPRGINCLCNGRSGLSAFYGVTLGQVYRHSMVKRLEQWNPHGGRWVAWGVLQVSDRVSLLKLQKSRTCGMGGVAMTTTNHSRVISARGDWKLSSIIISSGGNIPTNHFAVSAEHHHEDTPVTVKTEPNEGVKFPTGCSIVNRC